MIRRNQKKNDNAFKWLHDDFGSNFRLTEIQSCLGLLQLKKVDKWNCLRQRNSDILIEVFKKFPHIIRIPKISKKYRHAWYKFYV